MAFSFNFTTENLKKCLPRNPHADGLYHAFQNLLVKYDITSIERVAAFFAQCGHESNDFTVLKENLNYSAPSLQKVFPKYFPDAATATKYEHKPEAIANRIYGSRMGNGNEASGDGFKYRGRGAIQLTGKDNYTKFGKTLGKTADEAAAYCETLDGALESACWFWSTNGLNALADNQDNVGLTKRINGGTIGLDDRTNRFNNNLIALSQ